MMRKTGLRPSTQTTVGVKYVVLLITQFCERVCVSIDDFAAENATQIDFFHLLFTPEMFETIAEQTNHYTHCKIATQTNGDPLWKDITTEEIRTYFGIMILMGIHNLPRDEMYWASDGTLGVPGIGRVKSLKRYKKLSELAQIVDNTQPDQRNLC